MVTHSQSRIQSAGRVYRAIADHRRRRILEHLQASSMTAGEIADRFSTSRPAISRHLSVLRRAGLVHARKRGRERIYEIDPSPLIAVEQWASAFRLSLAAAMIRLKEHVESSNPGTNQT